MYAIRLRTEYLKNPVGIDLQNPRLMWNCADGLHQTACQVMTDTWDSGKVVSSSMQMTYPLPLTSRERVSWRVRLWDENDTPGPWSEPAFFEMGLLEASDWKARWISGDYKPDPKKRYPVDCFRRVFQVESIKKARLYITACGLYEARLNGRPVGDHVLAPGHTDYRKRVQYQTYDVTSLLAEGRNEITVWLADGWYRGSCGAWGLTNQYGQQTKLIAQLEITFADGRTLLLKTGRSWDWSNDGPIRFADNKDGEIVDARLHPSYSGKARLVSHPVTPTASNNVPVTEHERFTPTLLTTPSGAKVLDFGQNMAGYLEFNVTAKNASRILLRFGEMLDKDGEFTQKNIQCARGQKISPLQQVEYTCQEGENHYKTTFAVFGFRYVLVETGLPIDPEDFTAIAVYSDMEQTGFFESSNELLNRFVDATLWSAKSNHLDIPTDCPTRERHGWTGDAQIFFNTAAYLLDFAPFAEKYLKDVYDWQKKSGVLPQIAPYGGVDFYMFPMNGSVGWADIGILLPYRFWKMYGDTKILSDYYDRMVRYAEFMISRCGAWGGPLASRIKNVPKPLKKYLVNKGQSYGEWAEPADVHPMDWKDMAAPHPEVSTAYTSYVLGLMAEISETLGRAEDAERFRAYHEGCREAYQALVKDSLDTDRQAQLVRPLYMDLLEEDTKVFAENRLIQALENYGWRLGTGFLSTPLILPVLEKIDLEAAYRLLENEAMPGWLFMPKNGATTIWESWEGTEAAGGVASLNHYSKGAVCEWLFSSMCGIRVAGENHFVIAPKPGGHFTFAKARYLSRYGEVESGWTAAGDFTIVIPAGCTAEIQLPEEESRTVEAGTWTFTEKRKDS